MEIPKIITNFTHPKTLKVNQMLQREFEERTGVSVTTDEYLAIETVYMASDLDKDEFCKMWCKMNSSRIKAAKKVLAEKKAKEKDYKKFSNILSKLQVKLQELHYDFCAEPLTVNFLRESEVQFLLVHDIRMNISYQEAKDYGYLAPRHYRISETAWHIKKYLKRV